MSRRIKDLETIEKDTLNYLRVFSFNEINDTIMFELCKAYFFKFK